MHQQDKGPAEQARDRRDVAEKTEIEIVVKRGVDRVRRTDQQEGIAVRGRAHDDLRCDIAARAGPVLDDELLPEALRQPLTDQTRENVVRTAGGKTDDDPWRPRRVGVSASEARYGGKRASACCQAEKTAARKFQDVLLRSGAREMLSPFRARS